jgi:hypothetical protein
VGGVVEWGQGACYGGTSCVYDIINGSSEYHELSSSMPSVKVVLMARWAELNATTYEAPRFPLNEAMCVAYLASHRGFLGPYYEEGAGHAPAAVARYTAPHRESIRQHDEHARSPEKASLRSLSCAGANCSIAISSPSRRSLLSLPSPTSEVEQVELAATSVAVNAAR